ELTHSTGQLTGPATELARTVRELLGTLVGLLDALVQLPGALGGVRDAAHQRAHVVGKLLVAVGDLPRPLGQRADRIPRLDSGGTHRVLGTVDLLGVPGKPVRGVT